MDLELSQKQGPTLAMQTSMHLLQLNNLQLRSYLGELMTSNAVVELEYPEIEYCPSPFAQHGASRKADSEPVSKEQLMEDKANGSSVLHDLFLQCAAMNLLALQIVMQHLEAMAARQYSAIARTLNVPKAQVMEACERIRALNPKPLNGLGGEVFTPYIIPDFYIVEDGEQLRCILNDYYLPKIKIDPSYHELIHSGVLSTAGALSLHESTVSRSVNGKFFECKWGVFPLKSLFIHSTSTESVDAASTDQALERLRQLIAAETPGAAYSDQQLSVLLSTENLKIARRTVAKYRLILGIPSASQRNAKYRG